MEESITSLNSTNITDNSPKVNDICDKEKIKKENNKENMNYISEEDLKIISSIAINLEEIINDNYIKLIIEIYLYKKIIFLLIFFHVYQ